MERGDLPLELVGQRRLSDAGLPGEEDDLHLPGRGVAHALPELSQGALAADQAAPRRRGLHLSQRAPLQPADEPVAAPGQRLDVPRPLRLVLQHSPEVKDLVLDDLGLDRGAGPDRVEQLPVGHQLPGVLDEVVEDAELRRRQQNALLPAGASAAPEALVRRVEAEGRELCHG